MAAHISSGDKKDPIKHVVVLMLENRSFDQMLGCMKEVYPELEGIGKDDERNSCGDYHDAEHRIPQSPFRGRCVSPDPKHEHVNVERQIDPHYGFIVDYVQSYPHTPINFDMKARVMGYFPHGSLYALHTLAEHYAICDHWYSSVPGPTWPNRFFVHSGTSKGHVKMPNGVFDKNWHLWDQETLYDRLQEKSVSWKIYHHGMPQSLAMVRL